MGPWLGMSLPILGKLTVVGAGLGMPDSIQTSAGIGEASGGQTGTKGTALPGGLELGRFALCASRFHVCTGTWASLQKADFNALHLFLLSFQ